MRIAMLSDIHGNPIALDAVLEDLKTQGPIDEHWILGDHFNQGYDPVGAIERIAKLPALRCVSGNTDRYAIHGGRRGPSLERIIKDPENMVNMLTSVEQGNGWARGAVTATGWFNWLKNMPFEQRLTLPDGTRLLGVHASLKSDEWVVIETTTAQEAEEIFPNHQADLVFAGHAHAESDKALSGTRYITLGGIANPLTPDMRAKYAILEADTSGYQITFRHVAFDYQQVVDAIKKAQHPSEPWLLKFYQRNNQA